MRLSGLKFLKESGCVRGKRAVVAACVGMLLFIADADARPFGGGDPFGLTLGSGSEKQVAEEIKKYGLAIFGFPICMAVFEGIIHDLKMTITLPPEVEKTDGELAWQGDIDEGQKQCLNPVLKSNVPMDKWSRDVTGHIEFWYGTEKYRDDVSWGLNGYKDSEVQLMQSLDPVRPMPSAESAPPQPKRTTNK